MHKRNPIWWKRRSALDHDLTVGSVSKVLLCIVLAVGTAEALGAQPRTENVQTVSRQAGYEDLCLSPECIHTASAILTNMDPDVEPCNDFYRFACGGFLKSKFIPEGKDNVHVVSLMEKKQQEQLRLIMEEPSEPNERKPFRLVKNLYKSCTDTIAIEDEGSEPLHKILKKLGGWPVLDGEMWNEADFNWIKSNYKFRDAGYPADYFFRFRIVVDPKNEIRRMINLDTADLVLSYENLLESDNKTVKAYYSYMVDMAVLLGAERERATTELKESLLFEMNLANISLTFTERMNASRSYNLMTLAELTNNYTSIPWREYFNNLLPNNITVEENEVVIVTLPSFISDLEKLLSKTPKRVQANYVIWRAVEASAGYLNDDIRKRELAFWSALNNKTVNRPKWQQCVNLISERLPVAVASLYVRKYFNEQAKQNVVDIVMDIRKQFYKTLQQVKWMDDRTRQSALEKLAAMSSYIAYPDEFLDDTKLENFYENLQLSTGIYLDNILNLTIFNVEYAFSELREPVNPSDWVSQARPAVAEAFYSKTGNSIHFSAGILGGAFFSSERPNYMNYGGIGFVIAHEIAHSFSDMEHQFNTNGNNSEWSLTKENYLKRVQCIIHQYGNYAIKDVGLKLADRIQMLQSFMSSRLNGFKTRNENVADNTAIKEAYLAYEDWVEKNGPEQKLPGLPFSPNQMFWIAVANSWCKKWELAALKRYIKTSVHSPNEFRILGSLSNMPEFSRDFNCSISTKMNPEKKCSVW